MATRRALLFLISTALASFAAPADDAFHTAVDPVFRNVCLGCHNQQVSSGGMNIQVFLDSQSLVKNRDGWEIILQKLRSGEMPPKGIPKPPAEKVEALTSYVQSKLDEIDKAAKPDPGRVVAHRLNRYEYANTVRDLLAVDFQADKNFPTDDSGYGFDNIADVLSLPPVLIPRTPSPP